MSGGLAEFLLARISEDEAVAQDACVESTRWWVDGPAVNSGRWWVYATGEKFERREVADHIARHDPARVLAECEAKRRIMEEHYFMPRHESRDFGFEDGNCVTCRRQGPCVTLRALALPYADHPDYRPEWKP